MLETTIKAICKCALQCTLAMHYDGQELFSRICWNPFVDVVFPVGTDQKLESLTLEHSTIKCGDEHL